MTEWQQCGTCGDSPAGDDGQCVQCRGEWAIRNLPDVAEPCAGCGAEAGEECWPLCIGYAAHLDELELRAGLAPAACFCADVDSGTEHYHD